MSNRTSAARVRCLAVRTLGAGALVACAPAIACKAHDTPPSAHTSERAPQVPVSEPPAREVEAASPLGGITQDASEWTGVVQTRLAAGAYTYLEVRDATSLRWVATMGEGLPVGSAITVTSFGTRKDYYSPRLERSFSEVVFASVAPAVADR